MKTPTKTEYGGFAFKSKSEAIFARCLDLSPIVLRWFYEPCTYDTDSPHDWDFMAVIDRPRLCFHCGRMDKDTHTVLIEYKPSPPTEAYITNLVEKCRPLCEALRNGKHAKAAIDAITQAGGEVISKAGRASIVGPSVRWAANWIYACQREVVHYLEYGTVPMTSESYLVWGNPWSGKHPELDKGGDAYSCYTTYPIFTEFDRFGWGDFIQRADNGYRVPFSNRHLTHEVIGITQDIVDEAMTYRFDLVNGDVAY